MILKMKDGLIQGTKEKNLYLFKGIRYATAKRFEAPVPYVIEGEYDATTFGKKALQVPYNSLEQSEDCLNLNVYTTGFDTLKPVLVMIHGGAFQTGSNQNRDPFDVIQDKDFVYVSINYRLGVLGYLYQEEYPTSGNNGTLDQIEALKWVHHYISYFGGDPEKVTVIGSSAGAKSIGALMNSEAVSYFQQAILISGANQSVRDVKTAQVIHKQMKEIVGDVDLKTIPVEQLLAAQEKLCDGWASTCMFGPVGDGIVIDQDFYEKPCAFKGNVIIGSSYHELDLLKNLDVDFENHYESMITSLFGINSVYVNEDIEELSQSMPKVDAITKAISDNMYRTYTYRFAKKLKEQGNIVYLYSTKFLPAYHCSDDTLAFASNEHKQEAFPTHKERALSLGKTIFDNYLHFVMHGCPSNPEWKSLNQQSCQMVWDEECTIEDVDTQYCDRIPRQVFKLEDVSCEN